MLRVGYLHLLRGNHFLIVALKLLKVLLMEFDLFLDSLKADLVLRHLCLDRSKPILDHRIHVGEDLNVEKVFDDLATVRSFQLHERCERCGT